MAGHRQSVRQLYIKEWDALIFYHYREAEPDTEWTINGPGVKGLPEEIHIRMPL
jgi:hypothetical protein